MGYFSNNAFSGNYWASNMFHGAGSTPVPIPLTPFEEIMSHRPRSGNDHGLSHNFITLFHGRPTPIMFYEPDPTSFHEEYYYHSRMNQLFKKLHTPDGRVVWKGVGES